MKQFINTCIMAQVCVLKTDRVSHVWVELVDLGGVLVSKYRNFWKNWKIVP